MFALAIVNKHVVTVTLGWHDSNGYVYTCLFVNIEIKTFGWHIQRPGVVLKTFVVSIASSVGWVVYSKKIHSFFHYAQSSNPINASCFVIFIV